MSEAGRAILRDFFATARIVAWVCPIEAHDTRQPNRGTVEWDDDGVAHCLTPGCTFTSLTPPPLEDMPPLFHWSPASRREQILRDGLRVMQDPVTHTPEFRAPYVCLAETPSWAWALSGMRAEKAHEPGSWDLWQVNVNGKRGAVVDAGDDEHRWHEVRVHEQVLGAQMWHVATREIAALVPKRIQRKRTKGWRMPAGAKYVGRPTVYGNPWAEGDASHLPPGSDWRAWVVARYQRELIERDGTGELEFVTIEKIREQLAGKDLACWCPLVDESGHPVPCHADVLLRVANS